MWRNKGVGSGGKWCTNDSPFLVSQEDHTPDRAVAALVKSELKHRPGGQAALPGPGALFSPNETECDETRIQAIVNRRLEFIRKAGSNLPRLFLDIFAAWREPRVAWCGTGSLWPLWVVQRNLWPEPADYRFTAISGRQYRTRIAQTRRLSRAPHSGIEHRQSGASHFVTDSRRELLY